MRILLFCLPFLLSVSTLQAQHTGDAIVGEWTSEEGKGHINIYRGKDGKYYGKITWLRDATTPDGKPRLDKENPDPSLRKRPIVGLVVLRGFRYDADDEEWDQGKIYDPESGNDYSCYMELVEPGKLKVRGYVGVSLLGRTTYWTR